MRKHHSMYVLLLVMIVMLSLHLPSVRAQDGWEVYTDEECGFAVSYPTRLSHSRGARYAPNLPANTLTFGSRSGVSDLTIVSMENDLALPLAALSSRAFGGHFGVFQRVSSEERMINGVSAIRVIHAQPEIEGVVVRYISTFLQREQWVYWLFTQIATEPLTGRPVSTEQEARLSNYEQIVSGFTLLSAGPQKQLFLLSNVPVPPEDGEIPNSITAPSATFVWPSTGYIGYIYGRSGHNAIDIWTNTSGTGNVGSKGNPVYAVADGTIYTIFGDSDGLPMVVGVQHASLGLWTWYWHMADEYNYVSYITPGLYIGQAVSPDTLLGYQGNRRWEGMYDVIVHLHFGVSNVARSENQYGIDPSPYFGLPLNWNDPNHVPWMYYVERPSRCCGCLPASCCSARTAQVNTFPTEISWGSSTISNRAPVPLCTAS
jgi:murein DD-endopeptidase MepM/ murein hydrolase activator NlpD